VAGHGDELPTTTLIAPAHISIWCMQSLSYILNTYAATTHTLVSLKALTNLKRLKPQKLCVSFAAITFKLCMLHGNILIAWYGI
jgi:hypothetical protein